jgi:simple sugar transport system permease protein
VRIEARENVSWLAKLAAPTLAASIAMAVCAVLILWTGASPAKAYSLLISGALGGKFALSETLTRATPLIFTGLAAALAFRAKLWNIGAEGQLYIGACMASWLGTGMIDFPALVMVPALFLAGALAGGVLLLGPTLLKTRLGVDEVVTTLLLNFIVVLFVNWLVFGPWKDPMAMGWPQAAPIVDSAALGQILPKTRLHWGFAIALCCALLSWIFVRFTSWGYEIRAVGLNQHASRFAGIPVDRVIVRTALISGGLAGFAGVSELCGLRGYLTLDLSPGFGYSGIVVAMLAALHPLGVVLSALFVAVISIGADSMSRSLNISNYIAEVATAISLLAVLASMFFSHYKIRWR